MSVAIVVSGELNDTEKRASRVLSETFANAQLFAGMPKVLIVMGDALIFRVKQTDDPISEAENIIQEVVEACRK